MHTSLFRQMNIGGMLPNGRFFTPTESFWEQMNKYKDTLVLDAGCGNGDLVLELQEKEFKAVGCDINMRDGVEGYGRVIQLIDADRFPLTKGMTVLACRPDHSGWAEDLLERCIESECTFIYVGLERNFDLDFSEDCKYEIIAKDVGEDGEMMLLFNEAISN